MFIKKPGFNMLEMLLVTAMIILMAGIIAPIGANLFNRNNIDLATRQIVQNLRRAQTLAQAAEGNSDWGVYLNNYDSTIFKGSSYTARDISYDEQEELYGRATTSGLVEIVFNKATGTPKTIGTTTVRLHNETDNIYINAKGIISY